jgi:hypothetical protein
MRCRAPDEALEASLQSHHVVDHGRRGGSAGGAVSSNAPRRGASPPRPLRAPPRLAIRRGGPGHLCQVKF